MNEYYNLNEDEIDNALNSISTIIQLKVIENELGSIEHMYNKYWAFPTRRDYDAEGYNQVQESCLGMMYLDAIYNDSYAVDEVLDPNEDETEQNEELEEIYYNFKVKEEDRADSQQLDDEGIQLVVLKLDSAAINSTLELAREHRWIYNHVYEMAKEIASDLDFHEFPVGADLNLTNNTVEILMNYWAYYEIETAADALLRLETLCRDIVWRANNEW